MFRIDFFLPFFTMSFQSLDDIAYAISDNEAAKRLQTARHQLFESIYERMMAG